LSSILEALKKAERESTEGRDADLPWPAPLPKRSPYPAVRRRWWLPLGAVGTLLIGIALFWQLHRPDASRPTTEPVPPPVPEMQENASPLTRKAERPEPLPATTKEATTVVQPPAAEKAPKAPAATADPVQPGQQTVQKSPSPMVAKTPPSNPAEDRPQPSPPAFNLTAAPADPSRTAPRNIVQASRPSKPPLEKSDKIYRSDPRIELQALVWSPDTTERFVIVNNRLIKEGESVEGITVVRINPDDVLVSEGSNRWHEAFKIR
jgi:hypothetical protein